MGKKRKQAKADCPMCGGTGWLHGAQEWTPARMSKGTPYKSVRCECVAKLKQGEG